MFKIRNKETGEFAAAGGCRIWSKTGKTWSTRGHLNQHLSLVKGYNKYGPEAEIVEYEPVEKGTYPIP